MGIFFNYGHWHIRTICLIHISSHLLVYKDSGWMGDAIACSRYISGVGTNLIPLFIVGAYQCGIRDFDVQLGYEASLKK